MYQIKAGGGKKHIPQKNNPMAEKKVKAIPSWRKVLRQIQRVEKAHEETEREKRGSQRRP